MTKISKKKAAIPIRSVCRNCGAQTLGRYCHICGQDIFAGTGRKLRELLYNSLDVVFAWDNKVWRTLLYLVAFPGRLTKEFYAGRIARYVYPSKLFWFLSLVFFALLMNGMQHGDSSPDIRPPQENAITIEGTAESGDGAEPGGDETGTPPNLGLKSISWPKLRSHISSYAPYTVMLLVPVFALLIYAFFKRKGRYYSDYLIFSLHFHSFFFLLLSVMLVLLKVFPEMGGEGIFLWWIPVLYFAVALRTVYRPRIVPMIFKILLVVFLYGIIMAAVALISLILFSIWSVK